MPTPIHIGHSALKQTDREIKGKYVQLNGESFYKISNYDQMRPFFMSIVSHSDHWMFISSNGALTAGRKNAENALFPYYTDDKIHDSADLTGSKTLFLVERGGKTFLWEPFSDRYAGIYAIRRNIYKNVCGNKVIFEEINEDLELSFRYGWYNSDEFGFVKKSHIVNTGGEEVTLQILDGIQNLLPCGVDLSLQTERSTLVDAYKKNELHADTGLGLYLLSSVPVDKAEPSEALKASTVWSIGLDRGKRLLSSLQLNKFRKCLPIEQEEDIRAERGAYFVNAGVKLPGGEEKSWYFVAEVNQGPSEVAGLIHLLREASDLETQIEEDIIRGTADLARLVASADGIQITENQDMSARHFSNTLFNIMRGGVFTDNYRVQKSDLNPFIAGVNRALSEQHHEFLQALPDSLTYSDLMAKTEVYGYPELTRICYEYLPLTFSRRHGDPSRPWNRFSIETKKPDGSANLYYQGNWRDIFQNWEALGISFPGFIESMICKFVNASTADGYNPYRITRDGIDWEVVDPADPWSYIGYWGDHQIIYLLKLLELSHHHHPGKLKKFLSQPIFAYANVPYRIKSYGEILKDPFNTVLFDEELEARIEGRVADIGADGKLLWEESGKVYLVNLAEKLLVSVLAKFSNFIPEGGIWLNTQRPEWNDANNALVGNGVSMVTLYYMRRFQVFCRHLLESSNLEEIELSEEVATFFTSITQSFEKHKTMLNGPISDTDRKAILDELGGAGSDYRSRVYENGFSGNKKPVSRKDLLDFFKVSIEFIDHSIRANKRSDNLYHAYNLMTIKNEEEVSVSHLYEMLEGQVAVLSSGYLSSEETLKVFKALRASALYREDQHSYLLYPDRQLPRFLNKNNIPNEVAENSLLIRKLLADGNKELIEKDIFGRYHFNGNFHNAESVEKALEKLSKTGYAEWVEKGGNLVLEIFEKVFGHKSFTGRSGTFYGYEGLGCIYWHMVSKLLLAVEENCFWAREKGVDEATFQELDEFYYDIRAGIGFNKTPEEYGAFPSDPYSHTPGNAGAQQPGMTGQVKEDFLARMGELGIFVEKGKITFNPLLLRRGEFLTRPASFKYFDINGQEKNIELPEKTLAFTYCQVPVVFMLSLETRIELFSADEEKIEIDGLQIDVINSSKIFNRTGAITRIDVELNI